PPPVSSVPPSVRTAFDAFLGLEILEQTPDRMRGRIDVTESHKQPYGLVHGGGLASIAESLASIGTALAAAQSGSVAVGMSTNTIFPRPILEGGIHADAHPRHRGRP